MSDVSAYSGELWVSISGSCIIETGRCLSLEPSVVLIMDKIAEPSDILVSLDEFSTLCTRISDDSRFACKVGDVLVEPSTRWQNMLKGSSLYQKFLNSVFIIILAMHGIHYVLVLCGSSTNFLYFYSQGVTQILFKSL